MCALAGQKIMSRKPCIMTLIYIALHFICNFDKNTLFGFPRCVNLASSLSTRVYILSTPHMCLGVEVLSASSDASSCCTGVDGVTWGGFAWISLE